MKTNPSSPIEIKANALMIKHLNLLHRQTAMWIYSYLSNGLSTFHCDIPGFNLNCAGIVYFKNTSLLATMPDMLNTFEHALGASVLLVKKTLKEQAEQKAAVEKKDTKKKKKSKKSKK